MQAAGNVVLEGMVAGLLLAEDKMVAGLLLVVLSAVSAGVT